MKDYSRTCFIVMLCLMLAVSMSACGTDDDSAKRSNDLLPSAPTGLGVVPGDGQVTLHWDAVGNATSYTLYMDDATGVSQTNYTGKATSTSTSHIWNGLTNGADSYFVVTANNDVGESNDSAEVRAVPAQQIALPKTGQTFCYDELGNVIPCTGTGQDGEIQAGIGWTNPRFVDNGDGTVTDNFTGLMWLKDPTCFNRETWENALTTVSNFNLSPGIYNCTDYSASYSDWRLPNMRELHSLVDYGNVPALPLGHPFTIKSDSYHWSSTIPYDGILIPPMYPITILFSNGQIFNDPDYAAYAIWPVRGTSSPPAEVPRTGRATCHDQQGNEIDCAGTGQDGEHQMGAVWPYPRFTDNGDGTVTDNLTGLMWRQDAYCIRRQYPSFDNDGNPGDGHVTWQHGLDFVAGINNGTYADCGAGYTDWRLPNVRELSSLALSDLQLFKVGMGSFWSSTTDEGDTSRAWSYPILNFEVTEWTKTYTFPIWPVRGPG